MKVRQPLPGPRHALGRRADRGGRILGGFGHFEELGRPERLLHGGFGLLTVGNLRKPRFWALAMLNSLGTDEVAAQLTGDGAGSLVEAWPTRNDDGRVAIAVWNGTLDQSKAAGCAPLDQRVTVRVDGLPTGTSYQLRHHRLDRAHSSIAAVWERMGGGDWPDEPGWRTLREANRLAPVRVVKAVDGSIEFGFDLPMPAMSPDRAAAIAPALNICTLAKASAAELDLLPELVAYAILQEVVVLHAANDDAGRDADLRCESLDRAESAQTGHLPRILWRDEKIAGEFVRSADVVINDLNYEGGFLVVDTAGGPFLSVISRKWPCMRSSSDSAMRRAWRRWPIFLAPSAPNSPSATSPASCGRPDPHPHPPR